MYSTKIKESYGMAICRHKNNQSEILLCRRRTTYNFGEFVYGKYHPYDWIKITELINGMTTSEKIEILTFDFTHIWWKLNLRNPTDLFAISCKKKFETNFINRDRLTKAINNSKDIELLWEIPKGRPEKFELPIDTAIRETYEEVGVSYNDYKIIHDITPIKYHITVYNTQYNMKFYIAHYNATSVDLRFKMKHIKEIDAVQWWPLKNIRHINTPTPINNVAINALVEYSKWIKTK